MKLTFKNLFDQNDEQKNEATKGFFTDVYPGGYISKTEFIQFLKKNQEKGGQSNWILRHVKDLLHNMKMGKRLTRLPQEALEEGDKWLWCKFNIGKTPQNLKIVDGGGLHKLVMDYATGRIKVNYDLEDLLEEATKDEQ